MTDQRSKPHRKPKTKRSLKRWFHGIFLSAAVILFLAMAGYFFILINGERLLAANIGKMDMDQASILYDAHDREAAKLYRENRELAKLDEMPKELPEAFIATEDKRFYEHQGFDLWSIGRALVTDILHGGAVEGGSTITQQLAKNLFLSNQKTLFRKVNEVSIAMALENKYSKDEILEMYLNRIYFGNGVYGVKTAAEKYFGVSDLKNLSLWQCATLAGIPKAPAYYNPISDPARSQERRAVVLQLMYEQGDITKAQKDAAEKAVYHPPAVRSHQAYTSFTDYVVEEAGKLAGLTDEELRKGGYQIYTTLDTHAQNVLEQAFGNDSLFPAGMKGSEVQGGMVILNHRDGGIVGLMGGRDYQMGDYNRVESPRQPGSSFKPIAVYGPALETGNWTPFSLLKDEKMSFGNYSPRNYNNVYQGQVTMMDAVKDSINVPAVWLLDQIGVDAGMKFARKLGITLGPEDRNLSIALGGLTEGVTPLQMAQAYSAFADQGKLHKVHAIRKITDADGNVIYNYAQETRTVMDPKTSWYMTLMLQNVVQNGTGQNARMNRPVAGKTGTTQLGLKGISGGNRDVWFAGYTPEWTAAVWMGYDKTDEKHYLTGGSGYPARMFSYVMSRALSGKPVKSFVKPQGVTDPQKPPQPINDLTALPSVSDRSVQLAWTRSDDRAEFELYRKSSQETDFQLVLTTADTNIRDISVTPGESYQYYVVAVIPGTGLKSEKSNVVSVTAPTDGSQPGISPLPTDGIQPSPSPQPTDGIQPSPSPQPTDASQPGISPQPTDGSEPSPSPLPTASSPPSLSPYPTKSPGLTRTGIH
ncbi:transglycosylase domain-containing protein [Ferviditalea candida]|uniref:PBP1A family penicillin-binding protein n=1 Tax=Ferviditalea candida TaxID=3108399 RepID=A0ABU5ZJR0_9BACL|nr:PBP1A family penicillin-binding protein [Paenibacillaceae bacterium T2]